MKYKEFREYLKGTDFEIKEDNAKIKVTIGGVGCVEIPKTKTACPEEFDLIKKAIELAETPLEEREDEKKYYIKHKFINNCSPLKYISLISTDYITLNDHHEDQCHKTKFTKAEIEELKEKYETDLNDFEIIEVGE